MATALAVSAVNRAAQDDGYWLVTAGGVVVNVGAAGAFVNG